MIYNVLTNDEEKSSLIPVTDGSYYTGSMVRGDKYIDYNDGDFAIVFLGTDGVTPITPTAGTIVPAMATADNVYMLAGVGSTTINAAEVICEADGIATYTVPVFSGAAKVGKITLAGIVGASYAKAEFRRFK